MGTVVALLLAIQLAWLEYMQMSFYAAYTCHLDPVTRIKEINTQSINSIMGTKTIMSYTASVRI